MTHKSELAEKLLEELAEIEHDQWRAWARHLLYHSDGEPNLSERRRKRWEELINLDYGDLPEDWKEHDRVWARKVRDTALAQVLELLRSEDGRWIFKNHSHGLACNLLESKLKDDLK